MEWPGRQCMRAGPGVGTMSRRWEFQGPRRLSLGSPVPRGAGLALGEPDRCGWGRAAPEDPEGGRLGVAPRWPDGVEGLAPGLAVPFGSCTAPGRASPVGLEPGAGLASGACFEGSWIGIGRGRSGAGLGAGAWSVASERTRAGNSTKPPGGHQRRGTRWTSRGRATHSRGAKCLQPNRLSYFSDRSRPRPMSPSGYTAAR